MDWALGRDCRLELYALCARGWGVILHRCLKAWEAYIMWIHTFFFPGWKNQEWEGMGLKGVVGGGGKDPIIVANIHGHLGWHGWGGR